DPTPPERACLVLARLAGEKLNTVFVKAFVNAITFFPIGSVVRTSRNEVGVVVRTNAGDPLHPVVILAEGGLENPGWQVDTAGRDASGAYGRHVLARRRPPADLAARAFLAAADPRA